MKKKMLSAVVGIRLAMGAVGCLTVAMNALAAAEADADATPKAITVDAAAQARFGVSVATLKGAAAPSGTATPARVLAPGRLLKSDSERAAAAASFAASRAEALRARKLFSQDRTVSARV